MTYATSSVPSRTATRGLTVVIVGFVLVLCTLVSVLLVTVDKTHFGWLVGWGFLPAIGAGVVLGGVLVLIGSLLLPERLTWRGLTLIVWSLIAVTSPLFGIMFLFPWAVLAVLAPLVAWILRTLYRASRVPASA